MRSQPYPWEQPERDSYPDLNYLLSEGARCRYVIAAHYLRGCRRVVEIGGFKTPVTGFMTHQPESVLVVDPLIEPFQSETLYGAPCRVDHLRKTFQAHDFREAPGGYGLVLLGVSTKYFSDDAEVRSQEREKLNALVAGSKVAVLEHAIEWPLGREIVEGFLAEIEHRVALSVDLDLGSSPGMDKGHHLRRLRVIEPLAAL